MGTETETTFHWFHWPGDVQRSTNWTSSQLSYLERFVKVAEAKSRGWGGTSGRYCEYLVNGVLFCSLVDSSWATLNRCGMPRCQMTNTCFRSCLITQDVPFRQGLWPPSALRMKHPQTWVATKCYKVMSSFHAFKQLIQLSQWWELVTVATLASQCRSFRQTDAQRNAQKAPGVFGHWCWLPSIAIHWQVFESGLRAGPSGVWLANIPALC